MNAQQLVKAYYDCWRNHDLAALERILDPRFEFKGPMMKAESAQQYVQMLGSIPKEAAMELGKIHASFASADEACTIYDCVRADGASIPMAEHVKTRNGKITQIRLYADSRLFQ